MTKKSRLVFFGNERLATGVTTEAPTLQALIEAGYYVVAVVSHYERGQSRNARELEVQLVASAHNIPVLLPVKPSDIADQLASYQADAGILAAYGKIVPQAIIDIFPKGIINIHPSLLPLHRGPTPIESVILHGETETGVSIMQLSRAMDAGPVYGFTKYPLNGTETKQTLATDLLELGSSLLLELLPGILSGNVVAQPQDETKTTYDKLLTKEDGRLDLNKPAVQLEREVRAYTQWPKSYTSLNGKDVIITKAHTTDTPDETDLSLQTAKGFLVIDMLKPAGKNEMTAKEFLVGYGKI